MDFFPNLVLFNSPKNLINSRLAFSSLERDYLTWIDECLTRQVQNMDQNRVSNDQATLQVQFHWIFHSLESFVRLLTHSPLFHSALLNKMSLMASILRLLWYTTINYIRATWERVEWSSAKRTTAMCCVLCKWVPTTSTTRHHLTLGMWANQSDV